MNGNPRKERHRGFFSTDAGMAALLVTLAALTCIASLKASANALAWEAGLGSSESTALRLADHLLKECEWPGLSECDSHFAYSHVLSRAKVLALDGSGDALEKMLGGGKNVSIQVTDIRGKTIASTGVAEGGACVKRIACLDGAEVLLEACAQ